MKKSTIAVLVILAVLLVGIVTTYNSVMSSKIAIDAQRGQIENQIQRRADLIPNLISTVKGYMQHEEKVLNEVTEARTRVTKAGSTEDLAAANGQLSAALGRLIAVSENYPTLKADAHFTELMREISGSENRIAVARRDYNEAVRKYNTVIATFPGNLISGIMGCQSVAQFTAEESAHEVPKVSF
ncbi:MAG: LemA family protein [Desulfovibrio sp.]|nr:LemA family protein [Desulfovibrio sp.]